MTDYAKDVLTGKKDVSAEIRQGVTALVAGAKQATWQHWAMTGALAVVAVASCILIDRVRD